MPNQELTTILSNFEQITKLVAELIENYAVFLHERKILLAAVQKAIGNGAEPFTMEKLQQLERTMQNIALEQNSKIAITNIYVKLCNLAKLEPPAVKSLHKHKATPLLFSVFTRDKTKKAKTTPLATTSPSAGDKPKS